MNKINIMPAGFSMSFQVYRCETKPIAELLDVIAKDELTANLEKLKPGFFKIETHTGLLISSFAYPQKQEIEILKHGVISKLEVPVLLQARIVFLPGFIVISGNNQAGRMALQMLSPFLNISGSFFKPTQEKLFELVEQAVVIKSMKFDNVPGAEVEQLTFSGEIEDCFNQGDLPLRESEINNFTGVFNSLHGIKGIKFTRSGKTTIMKSKREPISIELLTWTIEKLTA